MKTIYITEAQYNGLINEVRYLTPPNYKTMNNGKEQPIMDSETIRVYHGFNRFSDAENVMQNGLSGKENADRIYSFEVGNNPYGLFVSIDVNMVAKSFAHGGVIIEFTTKVSDLEAPVWVGGRSYFVQGEYTKSFKNLDEREQQRLLNRQRAGENPYDAISKSDRPELAETLFDNAEKQALYIGDLDPNMIKYVWYNEKLHKERMTNGKWERLTRKDFINRLNVKTKKEDYKIWYPNDNFSLDKFFDANGLTAYYKDKRLRIDDHLFHMFMTYNEYDFKRDLHLFPKQIKQIMDLRKTDYFQSYIDNHNRNLQQNESIRHDKKPDNISEYVKKYNEWNSQGGPDSGYQVPTENSVFEFFQNNYEDCCNDKELLKKVLSALKKESINEDIDYRGEHGAPSKSGGDSPLYDVTGTYPEDIYTNNDAAIHYGDGEDPRLDNIAISIIRLARNKPNMPIKIYRAVPDLNKDVDKKIKTLRQLIAYYDKYSFWPMKNNIIYDLQDKYDINSNGGYDNTQKLIYDDIIKQIQNLYKNRQSHLKINTGDWVTIVKEYAKLHGQSNLNNSYKIIIKTTTARHLYTEGNSVFEWGYDEE